MSVENNNLIDIYLITNLINGKQYVGQSIDYKERFRSHCFLEKGYKSTIPTRIDKAIKKYGSKNFKVELIDRVSFENRNEMERFYIKKYDTYNNGYNATKGGDFNPMWDKEIREKHRIKCTSEEHRQKQREAAIKLFENEEIHKKITEGNKRAWKNYNEEKRNQILKGFKQCNESKRQRVACVDDKDNVIKEFESASEACRFTGRDSGEAGNLLLACDKYIKSGKRRVKLFGYYWIKL